MFGKYEDLVLIGLILGQFVTITLIVLSCFDKNQKKILKNENRLLERENYLLRSLPELLTIVEQNSKVLKNRGDQIDQINQYLSEVLQISNLISCHEKGADPTIVIAEIRARIRWAEATRKHHFENIVYYQPDK